MNVERLKISQEIAALKQNNPHFLYLCQIHLTYQCNITQLIEAKCQKYCYQQNKKPGHMSFDTFQKIITTYTPRQIALGGGEPTLHPDFLRFIQYSKLEAPTPVKHVNYTTNAIATPSNFKQIERLVSAVSISIDSLRYPGLFTRGLPKSIKTNLKIYHDSAIQVIINYVINDQNFADLQQIIPFLKSYDINGIYLLSYKQAGSNFILHTKETHTLFMQFLKEAQKNKIIVGIDCCSTIGEGSNHQRCGAGSRFRAFDLDGTETACSFTDRTGKCPIIHFNEKY